MPCQVTKLLQKKCKYVVEIKKKKEAINNKLKYAYIAT